MRYLLLVFILATVTHSYAGVFGPRTYEECILENMKGASSDIAAHYVHNACREKFPLKIPKRCKQSKTDNLSQKKGLFDDIPINLERCIQNCQSAGYLNRTFGECKLE